MKKNTHKKGQVNKAICQWWKIHKETTWRECLLFKENAPHLSRGKSLKAYDGYFIIRADFVIISRISEGKGQQALFFQVCLCSEIWKKKVEFIISRNNNNSNNACY